MKCPKKEKGCFPVSSAKRLSVGQVKSSQVKFVCTSCNKTFSMAGNLKKHKLTHSWENQFVCTRCYKTFSEAGSLKRHNLTHSGGKQFACVQCNKAFLMPAERIMYMLSNIGEKRFACIHCDKAFNRSSHLTIHIPAHRREAVCLHQLW